MSQEQNFPVLIGVGQVLNRIQDLADAKEPLAMMLDAITLAEKDTQVSGFLHKVDSVRVIRGMWRYANPAKYIAEKIGAPVAETVGTLIGGNQNQAVINETANQILQGERKLVVITGAENGNSSTKARKAGINLETTDCPGEYDRVIGASQHPEHSPLEREKGIFRAIQVYPMYDNAIRYARGETMNEHIERVSGIWSRFNDVAQRNPNAWVQHDMSAAEIRTPSVANRPISFPYTKFMNANMSVNMGAALIMTSVSIAKALGVPEERWVFPVAGVKGYDHHSASVRDEFHTSPGIRKVGQRLLNLADTTVDELDFVDLYSCFPSAVQVAAKEYGLDEERDLTVTGGLTFGGGPLNNYVMHSIARTVELLRETPDGKGLVTANGGNIYKHVHGIYSKEPPSKPFVSESVQSEIDVLPARNCLADFEGEANIESYTVMYEGFIPKIAHISLRTPDYERVWVNSQDSELVEAMTHEEFCGRNVKTKTSADSVQLL
ncbi:MAG: acetyl-CoA acetyltransferase [Gammaproteobacteria bacterium]|nr:acetyl-CoA acetyltransferase [Gammaproteobacteria bacterium]